MSCALPDMMPSAARARMRGARRSRVFRNRPGIPSMLNPPAPDCSPPTRNAAETRKRKTSSNQRKWDAPFNNPYSDLYHTLIYTMLQEMIWCFRCKDTSGFFEEIVFGDSLISNDPLGADCCSSTLLVLSIP